MPIDTSIYQVPQQPNALQQFGNAVGISNQVEQNKLLRGQQVQQQTQIDTGKLELAVKQLGTFRNMLAPLINNPNGVSERDVTNVATMGIQQKLFTPQQAASSLANFPRKGTAAEKQKFVRDLYTQALSHENQISLMLGPVSGINSGGGTTLVQTPQMPGLPAREVGSIQNTLQPGTKVFNEEKSRDDIISRGEPGRFQPTVAPAMVAAPQSTSTDVPPMEKADVTVGPRATEKNQDRLPASAPIGFGEAKTAEAISGQKAGANLNAAADDLPQQIAALDNMADDLKILGDKVGPGAGLEKVANALSQRMTGFGITMSKEQVAAAEGFDKLGRQIAMAQAGALHATDQTLQTTLGANPNLDLSYLGNNGIINLLKGNADAIALKRSKWIEWRKAGNGPETYWEFSEKFNRNFDPRVFQFARMQKLQREKFLSRMDNDDKDSFERKLYDAQKKDWIRLQKNDATKPK